MTSFERRAYAGGVIRPSAQEYARTGPVRRALRRFVTLAPIAAMSARMLPLLDTAAMRVTRGRATLSGWLTGLPIVELRTTGARSGLPRTARVMAVPDAGDVLVAAANFGSERNPAWYANVRARPEAEIVDDARVVSVRVVELAGAEREEAFTRALRLNPGWARFRARAGARRIPVLRLSPIPDDRDGALG